MPVLFPHEKENTGTIPVWKRKRLCSHTQNLIELSSPLDQLVWSPASQILWVESVIRTDYWVVIVNWLLPRGVIVSLSHATSSVEAQISPAHRPRIVYIYIYIYIYILDFSTVAVTVHGDSWWESYLLLLSTGSRGESTMEEVISSLVDKKNVTYFSWTMTMWCQLESWKRSKIFWQLSKRYKITPIRCEQGPSNQSIFCLQNALQTACQIFVKQLETSRCEIYIYCERAAIILLSRVQYWY